MRPPCTYANPSDGQYLQLRHALHRQWRVPTRAMMVLLSANGFALTEVADRSAATRSPSGAGSPATPPRGCLAWADRP